MSNTENNVEIITSMHVFERALLGKAPFTYIGMEIQKIDRGDGTFQPAGTCDYCGNGIMNVCHIQSADGKRFKVGCDCVAKLDRDNNCPSTKKLISQVEAAKREHNRKLSQARAAKKREAQAKVDAEKLAELVAIVANPQYRETLAAAPHPYGRQGGFLNCVEWFIENTAPAVACRKLGEAKKILGI